MLGLPYPSMTKKWWVRNNQIKATCTTTPGHLNVWVLCCSYYGCICLSDQFLQLAVRFWVASAKWSIHASCIENFVYGWKYPITYGNNKNYYNLEFPRSSLGNLTYCCRNIDFLSFLSKKTKPQKFAKFGGACPPKKKRHLLNRIKFNLNNSNSWMFNWTDKKTSNQNIVSMKTSTVVTLTMWKKKNEIKINDFI